MTRATYAKVVTAYGMQSVLISGAGIGGPALAHWLGRRGVRCTVVERASSLRAGGQAVDFRGPVHQAVLERMDLWRAIHERRTVADDLVLLDGAARPAATIPAVMMAGDVEIHRGDLVELLYERTRDVVEYRFGDRIRAIEEDAGGVHVTFASGKQATYDLVVGADGLHSGVRALAFGPDASFVKHHGYRIATFDMPNPLDRVGTFVFTAPGRALAIGATGGDTARALFVHVGGAYGEERWDLDACKRELHATYGGLGWHVPAALDALGRASEVYVDGIASVHVDRWSRGRVVLLGDAAYGGTLGGQGTSLAIVGAYVLAGELAHGDFAGAFERYESRMRDYAEGCQKGATRVGGFFAPKTRFGIATRNFVYRTLTSRLFVGFFEKLVKGAASSFTLPTYALDA